MAFHLTKKLKILLTSGFIVLVALFIGISMLVTALTHKAANSNEPSFNTVLPANSTIADFGGWQKHTSPNGDIFFSYLDEIDSIPISVSQQQLPDGFANNLDAKMSEIAKGYNASKVLDANGVKVYIGNNAKGPQSVIFSKNSLLITIQSQKEIQNASWISYINSLK
jgi:hypothetical protein